MNKQNVKTKINDVIGSPKFVAATNLLIMVGLVLLLCKSCGVEKNNKNNAEEIAGLKKEIANLKNGSVDLGSKFDNLDDKIVNLDDKIIGLSEIVDSCCCDCNKKTVVKPVAKPKPVVKKNPVPVVIHDTVVKVVRDTVIKEPEPVVQNNSADASTGSVHYTLYVMKSKRR